jgi:hypothetical protein
MIMKYLSVMFLVSSVVLGCKDRGFNQDNDVSSAQSSNKVSAGEFFVESDAIEGSINIGPVLGNSSVFSISVVNKFGGHNMADFGDAKLVFESPSRGVYKKGKCEIIVTPVDSQSVKVSQVGSDVECEFGAHVSVNGIYRLRTIPAGEFFVESDSIEGSIKIGPASGNSSVFSISVVNKFGGHNMADFGDAKLVFETPSRGVYKKGKCQIIVTPGDSPRSVRVSQLGSDVECEFGAHVSVNGIYRRK